MENKKKVKKPLTLKEQQKKYNRNSKLLYASKPFVTALPLGITLAVKGGEWFNQDWKVATGGTIAIILMALSSLLVNKKTEDKSITNTWITLVLGWYVVAFIFMLLSQIANEIWWLMMVAGSGMLASCGIDFAEKNQKSKAEKIRVANESAEEDMLKEQAKREYEKENKKVEATE